MDLITKDHSWLTDDDAGIHFSRQQRPFSLDVKTVPPATITAVRNQSCLIKPPTVEIPLSELELLIATKCEPRGGNTKWNSNTTCGAYHWKKMGKPGLVIYQVNGTGNHFMFMDQLELFDSFTEISKVASPIVIWDLIQSWFNAYERGSTHSHNATKTEYTQAFVDGRLKKRKHRGRQTYKVWIEDRKVA